MPNDEQTPSLKIALAGGNALGAFQAGALCALLAQGLHPAAMTGVSIGSVNTVLFAAPRDGDPERALRKFWNEAAQDLFTVLPGQHEILAALTSLLFGRPTLARSYVAPFPAALAGRNALQDLVPLARTLEGLVDLDRLSSGPIQVFLGATALEPDEPFVFDAGQTPLRSEHVLASCALPVLFPPVAIGNRTFVDGGVSENILIAPLLDRRGENNLVVLDLFARGGPVPDSLDAAIERLQSLMFAFQSEAVLGRSQAKDGFVRLIHATYRPPERESAGKTLDFSRRSVEKRWVAGEAVMKRIIETLDQPFAPGLTRI